MTKMGIQYSRYDEATNRLFHSETGMRLARVTELERLANEDPQRFHIDIMKLFCVFACNAPSMVDKDSHISDAQRTKLRPDLQAVLTAVGKRSDVGKRIERRENYRLDLGGAKLDGADLSGLDLRNVDL